MKRYISLDVLRGLTVTFMCIVNNPGSWNHVFAPLRHSPWNGCTPTDLVAPFFIFCVGCAMAFSFAKFDGQKGAGYRKVITRGISLFVVGLLLNMLPFFPVHPHDPDATFWQNWVYWLGHVRIFGILQHIALSYVIAGLLVLWLGKPSKIIAALAALSVLHMAVLQIFGAEPGAYTLEGNVAARIDVALVGPDHVYHGYRLPDGTRMDFDPEGLMTCISGACSALLGYLIGHVIRSSSVRYAEHPDDASASPAYMVARVFVYGSLSLAFAEILSIFVPINKPLWTIPYVFYSGGWAMVVLAFLAFVIDMCGIQKPFYPFKVMGTNALMAFVLSAVIGHVIYLSGWSYYDYFDVNEFTSLAWALIYTSVVYFCLWLLYRRNIVVKL